MAEKCPICFRTLGTWTDDPIYANPSLSDYRYLGFTTFKTTHIEELQNDRHQLETDLGLSLTPFSPINDSGIFQDLLKYIIELRQSTEQILIAVGMTKYDYFNYDEDGTYMGTTQQDWTDVSLEADKFQFKGKHIEDLRHPIQTYWEETWTKNSPIWIKNSNISITQPPYPDPGVTPTIFDDVTLSPFLADHRWLFGVYNCEIQAYSYESHLDSTVSLNLSSSNLQYDSLTHLHRKFWYDYIAFRNELYFELDAGQISKKIGLNTKLSWTGTFTGSVDVSSFVGCWAYIQLFIRQVAGPAFTLTFIKYGTNSAVVPGFMVSSGNVVSLSSWSGNDINLHDILNSFGYDMLQTYIIQYVYFRLWNSTYYVTSPATPLDSTSLLNVSLTNLKIA